jgi:type IV pilus assembly protein PilY1
MWYAAKYGGFTDTNANARPDLAPEWDRDNNATGLAGPDGMPDNYFLVTNPLQLAASLARALNAIGKDSSGTAVMANSTSLSTTNRIYQARYDPLDWSGQLLAKDVQADGRIAVIPTWDAGKKLNNADTAKRLILTLDEGTRDGVSFEAGSLPSSPNLLLELNKSPVTGVADGLGLLRLDWLRGDASREMRKGGPFRSRTNSILGDIAGSDPTYVGAPNAPRTERAYGNFRREYYSRAPMLYVGANDGMVHGFDAVTGDEKIAYIPSKLHPHLAKLTSTTYSHRFYVDGPPEAADAVVSGAWRSVLVGGLGGGGQGVYALDVTDPGTFSRSTAANHVMWEFNDTDDADLGYVYGKPVVRQMANGKWAAIVSGGYNNSEGDTAVGTGRAFLFILFLDGPTGTNRTWQQGIDYIKIDTGVGDATTPNGLAAPFVADADGDGKADFAYAGDLQGNFWKFDLTNSASAKNWTDPANKVVLFKAIGPDGTAQPITAPAEGTLHPTGRGFMLVFGTGKYIEVNDSLPSGSPAAFKPQSFYGVWDKNDKPTNVAGQTVVANRTELLDQVIGESGTVRTLPAAVPDWNTQKGWRMDFPRSSATGERAVFRPLLISSRLIFTTLIPIGDPCSGGGTSFLMIVDPASGGRVDAVVLDLNRDGVLNDSDKVGSGAAGVYASGIQSTVGIAPTPVIVKGGPSTGTNTSGDKIFGTRAPYLVGPESLLGYTFMGGPLGIEGMWIGLRSSAGRVSWREIITN